MHLAPRLLGDRWETQPMDAFQVTILLGQRLPGMPRCGCRHLPGITWLTACQRLTSVPGAQT